MCEACGPNEVETPLVVGLDRLEALRAKDPRLTLGIIPLDFSEDLATINAKVDAWLAEEGMGLP